MKTEVFTTQSRFGMGGQRLARDVTPVHGETISAGLAHRLHQHAQQRMVRAGFRAFLEGAAVEVYTLDGECRPSDRTYTVRFRSAEGGGYVEVCGIHTSKGWPTLDFGFYVGED